MTTKIELVGWDDARGRPIYRHSRPVTTKYYPKGSKVNIVINKHENVGGGFDSDCDAASGQKHAPPTTTKTTTMSLRGAFLSSFEAKYNRSGGEIMAARKETKSMQRGKARAISLSPAEEQTIEGCDLHDKRTSPCPSLEAIRAHPRTHNHIVTLGSDFASTARRKRRKKGYGIKTSFSSAVGIFAVGAFLSGSETINIAQSPQEESCDYDEEVSVIDRETPNRHESPRSPISSTIYDQEDGHLASPAGDSSIVSLNNQEGEWEENILEVDPSQMQGGHSDVIEDECIDNRGCFEHNESDSFASTPSKHREHPSIDCLRTIDTLQSEVDERRYGSDEDDLPTFYPTSCEIPLTRGEESAISPHIHARRDSNVDEFAEFDITFDDQEPTDQTKQKRRSYGDVKPVWMSNKLASTGASGIIGWDDAKCRPIFHAPPRHPVPSNEASTCVITSIGKSLPPSDDPRTPGGSSVHNKRTQKKKVYATLFKKSGLSQTMRDAMGMDSPPPVRDPPSTCPFALSVEKGPVTKFSNNFPCIENGVVHDKKVHVGSCQQSGASRKIDSDVESFGDDSNAHRVQPHSKSSLSSARAFFRYLDSNHNLTILHQNEPPYSKIIAGFLTTYRTKKEF